MSMDASDALTQSVKVALDGTEHVIKIVGTTTEQIEKTIAFMMALLKKNQDKPSIGKTNLVKMLQSGQALKAVTLKQDDLPRFAELAKQYGLPFTPVKDTTKKDGQLDVLIRENDAESINRVFEVLNGEKVVDDPKKKHSQPEQKSSEPNGKTLENNKEMASAQPIQIEANEPLPLPEGLEHRMAKSVEPATFFLYDEKSKQNIPITPKMQQDMQKGIRIPTVKEEKKPSVIAKIEHAKKELQNKRKNKSKSKSQTKSKPTTERG